VKDVGLAVAFRRRFPQMHTDYRRRCAAGQLRLGESYVWASLLPPRVVGFPTKGANPAARSRLTDIDRGLAYLVGHLDTWAITSLAVPALGCGYGGLAWRAVAPVLHRHLHGTPVPVEVYAPPDVPVDQVRPAGIAAAAGSWPTRPTYSGSPATTGTDGSGWTGRGDRPAGQAGQAGAVVTLSGSL